MTFEFFKQTVRDGLKSGELKMFKDMSSKEPMEDDLSDFDLATQFAIGEIGKRRGYPLRVTAEDIYQEIAKFAPELLEVSE